MLSLHALSYRIGGFQILTEVEGMIKVGEVVALVGPNGAGKSTLADIISGFRRPSGGRVVFAGREITEAKPYAISRLGIARMFQGAHLAWNLTSKENILAGLPEDKRFTGGQKERAEIAMSYLERVGLPDRSEELARRLSFGQQRLLALARVLVREAKCLLLDEPFSGLKGAALERIMNLVLEEAGSGKAILIIDHLLSALRDLRCPFWYLRDGHLTRFSGFVPLAESELFRSGYGASAEPVLEASVPAEQDCPAQARSRRALCRVSSARIGYNTTTAVIESVDFVAYSHEVIAIVGLNGVGKSTLLRAITGTCSVLGGWVELLGKDVTTMSVHKRIRKGLRVLPQDHRLFLSLSTEENWKLAAAAFGLSRKLIASQEKSAIIPRMDRVAGTLSGGEQARIALEMIDTGEWSVMLLDEPTTGLDLRAKDMLSSRIVNWRDEGKAIIFVEHDFDFVLRVASRAYIVTPNGLYPIDFSGISTGYALLKKVLIESEPVKSSSVSL